MKNLFKFIIAAALAVLPAVVNAQVTYPQDGSYVNFAATGTAYQNTGTNYVIIPPDSLTGGAPLITYLNMSANFATGTSTLTSYISTSQTTATAVNSTTNLFVASTNGYAAGQWIIIQHGTNSLTSRLKNEAAIIFSVQNTNQISLYTAPTYTVNVGDVINNETAAGNIPLVSSATTPREINGPGILTGQRKEPFLLVLLGSAASTNTINVANSAFGSQ